MAINQDIHDAVKQVFLELVLPRLEEIKADIRRVEKKLDTRRSRVSHNNTERSLRRPLSPQGQAYMDTLFKEIHELTEREAKKWARQRAKDPKT